MDRRVEFGNTHGGNGQTRQIDRGEHKNTGKDKTEGCDGRVKRQMGKSH